MASNSFGTHFRITTWGESHGPAVGVVIDGCPAGIALDEAMIQEELQRRAPGNTAYTSPRKESDEVQILSGVFEGRSTGAPIALQIANRDQRKRDYEPVKDLLKPGHAQFAYLAKYRLFDYRGSGRASARETAARVAAGAVAKQFLRLHEIEVEARLQQVGEVTGSFEEMVAHILQVAEEGDSIGGAVSFRAEGLPAGLGDPMYLKLPATLSFAMMSLPAAKSFEMGLGVSVVAMRGSEHNDTFSLREGEIRPSSNRAGGTLGGISTGEPLLCRVCFKPTSSIRTLQQTVSCRGEKKTFSLPEGARHDPCVAVRAVPVVEAMGALVLADALCMQSAYSLTPSHAAGAPAA